MDSFMNTKEMHSEGPVTGQSQRSMFIDLDPNTEVKSAYKCEMTSLEPGDFEVMWWQNVRFDFSWQSHLSFSAVVIYPLLYNKLPQNSGALNDFFIISYSYVR